MALIRAKSADTEKTIAGEQGKLVADAQMGTRFENVGEAPSRLRAH